MRLPLVEVQRHVLQRTRDQTRNALQVRRAAGPVARARREGPRPLNRSALDRDAGGHVLNVGFRPLPQTTRSARAAARLLSAARRCGDAWNLDSADRAARVLARLAGSLERDHPVAAASIREGLDETLTVQRLGLTGALQRTLRTTNIIENLNGSVERYTRNVERSHAHRFTSGHSDSPGYRPFTCYSLSGAWNP